MRFPSLAAAIMAIMDNTHRPSQERDPAAEALSRLEEADPAAAPDAAERLADLLGRELDAASRPDEGVRS